MAKIQNIAADARQKISWWRKNGLRLETSLRDLIRKLPFQFRSKPTKIEAILKAIEEELNELDEARSQLETLCTIETAEGNQSGPDWGDRCSFSRADAGLLATQAGNLILM